MANNSIVDRLLKNMDNIYELGKQRAFELGNPFYAKYEGDGELYHKEMPTGQVYLVKIKVIYDENDMPVEIEDTVIKRVE